MREYWTSDYAINKDSKNIVYQFVDGKMEITMEDYLKENPDKSEQDFIHLKKLSDELFYEQALEDTRYGKRKQTLGRLEESEQFALPAIDTMLIHSSELKEIKKATKRLLESGQLTKTQRRRFLLHFFQGYSTRKIAQIEAVTQQSVWESLSWSAKKLKKFYIE